MRNFFNIFKEGLDLEYSNDMFFSKDISGLKIVCLRPSSAKVIIDKLKSKKYIQKLLIFLNITIILIYLLWIILLPIYYTASYFYYLVKLKPKLRTKTTFKNKILIGTTHHATRMLSKLDTSVYKECTFLKIPTPWYQRKAIIDKSFKLSVLNLGNCLSILDHIKCLIITIFYSYKYILTSPFSASIQTYLSFEFILIALALEKILTEESILIYMNMQDRWQILFDRFPINFNRIHVQHGEIYTYTELLKPNTKFRNINKLYYFDKKSMNAAKKYLLEYPEKITFMPINHGLKLRKIEKLNNDFSVLIIPSVSDFKQQNNFIKKLIRTNININIIIKPHPLHGTFCPSEIKKNVLMIDDKDSFPLVNLVVVCDSSSLGIEYEFMKINVIWLKEYTIIDNAIKEILLQSKHSVN